MEKCNCYVEETYLTYDNVLRTPNYKTVSRCYGTKEREACSCGGNEAKCNFYPKKRAAAQARKATDEFKANRKYTYEETREQFLLALNSNAYLNMCESSDMENVMNALDKQVPKKPIGDLHSVPHYRCPNCKDTIVVYESEYRFPCCPWCGQAIDWE